MRNPVKDFMLSVATLAMAAFLLYTDAWSAATTAGNAGAVRTTAGTGTTANAALSDTAAMLQPSTTTWATRGLLEVASAEPMGTGRLTASLAGTWYRQERDFPYPQKLGTDIMTGIAAVSYGINPYLDIFTSLASYGVLSDSNVFGVGSITAGIQGALPVPEILPLRLGAQLALIGGTSTNQINTNFLDGYDYYETRVESELMGKILETYTFGNDSLGIKLLANQGASMLLRYLRRKILLLGGGIEGSVSPRIVLGLAMNSRSDSYTLNVLTDPLWLTPSILYRTPYNFNVLAGVDVSLSKDRDWTQARALEPYRIFIGVTSSFDLLAGTRRAEREKALREKMEMERKIRDAQARSAYLARKAQADSIALARAREADARKADSMAQKAREDSIALADTRRKLDEERSKRSDAEKQLLSTGMLLLDAVYFETGKAQISINSFPYLNIIGKMLTKYPKLQIEVAGHTDNVGKYDNNITLSQSRSEEVRRYLIQVAPDLLTRISARGYGSTQPKAPNNTAEGRKLNRRVELQVLNKEVLKEYN